MSKIGKKGKIEGNVPNFFRTPGNMSKIGKKCNLYVNVMKCVFPLKKSI